MGSLDGRVGGGAHRPTPGVIPTPKEEDGEKAYPLYPVEGCAREFSQKLLSWAKDALTSGER